MRQVDDICERIIRMDGVLACGAVDNLNNYGFSGDMGVRPIVTQSMTLIRSTGPRVSANPSPLKHVVDYNIRIGDKRVVGHRWGKPPEDAEGKFKYPGGDGSKTFDVVVVMYTRHPVSKSVQRLLRRLDAKYCMKVQSDSWSPENERPAPSSGATKTAPSSRYPEGRTPPTGDSQGDE